MTLRIDKVSDGRLAILRLSGRLESQQLGELKAYMKGITESVTIDLSQVKLVDRDAVCFLAACEAEGVELSQCSPYIREWINRERAS